MNKPELPIEYLRSLFSYNPENGILTHIKVRDNHKRLLGKECRTHDVRGYYKVQIDKIFYPTHRVVWAMHYGKWPKGILDHINNVKDDNRIENLRIVTTKQNSRNRPISGASKLKNGKWRAQISVDKVRRTIGEYSTREEAEDAYAVVAKQEFGEFYFPYRRPGTPATQPESNP